MNTKPKIVCIVGPTASGKTSLSIKLAQKFHGEVISADSRQVYQGLDIGTGKITQEEMRGIPHHLLDVAKPQDTYTVTDYVRDARRAITNSIDKGSLPIIVGGTFFYMDALLGKVIPAEVPPNEKLRAELETVATDVLIKSLERLDPDRAETIDRDNRRRIIRALEIVSALGITPKMESQELYTSLALGITISKEELQENIHTRLITRLEAGMIEEVQNLFTQGLSYERMDELGLEYRYIAQFLQNMITKEEMCTLIETKSMQYAKRQMTWLKRDPNIVWINPHEIENIEKIVENFVNK